MQHRPAADPRPPDDLDRSSCSIAQRIERGDRRMDQFGPGRGAAFGLNARTTSAIRSGNGQNSWVLELGKVIAHGAEGDAEMR